MLRNAVLAFVAFGAFVLACDATNPPGPPAAVEIVAGNGQQAVVGSQLPEPIVLRVVDAAGRGVPGTLVTFHVVAGGGTTALGTGQTDENGEAREWWKLGTTTAEVHRVEARLAGSGLAPLVTAFTATALADAPAIVSAAGGNNQSGTVNGPLSSPLVARVTDKYGNPVPAASVQFAPQAGHGSIAGATTVTGTDGLALSGVWQLGTSAGEQRAVAITSGATSATFTATGVASAAAALGFFHAQPTVAQIGATFGTPFAIQVQDAFGNAVLQPGVTVAMRLISGGGTLSGPSTAVTDVNGRAFFSPSVVGLIGDKRLEFAADNLTPLHTTPITFMPGPPASVQVVSGNAQSDTIGSALTPPVVRVLDIGGNAVRQTQVFFAHGTGDFSVTGSVDTTDGSGLASPTAWVLGTRSGAIALNARAGTASASVGATSLPGQPQRLDKLGWTDSVAVAAGAKLDRIVGVRDRGSNLVPGVEVTFTVLSGGGSVTPATSLSSAFGSAPFSWTLGSMPGENRLEARTATGITTVFIAIAQ